MNLDIGNFLLSNVKSLGTLFLKEIKNYMQDQNITIDAKSKINKKRNELIENYADIYEVKNGELKLYSKGNSMPIFVENTDLESGFYKKRDEKLELDENLTNKINEEIDLSKQQILKEEKEFIASQKQEGEEYIVDEIGDDEKYVFLTRKSTGTDFQEYIDDELYNKLLNVNDKSNIILIYENGNYRLK